MCILCCIQRWSRKVATMLPWLIIPMIGLWALSQLFPPTFRFEITSTRLACVSVLLITLFWYEILMPNLSSWRMKRNSQMREKKRFEAIEMQKLRKTATRRCRNCLTPYRDQNPGGGKFMCSYCGHVSKRPVLDLPVPPGLSSSGIWKDWLENGNCGSGPFRGKGGVCQKNGREFHGNEEKCQRGQSFSLLPKMISYFVYGIVWVWRKITGGGSSGDDVLLEAERRRMLAKRGDNAGNESRGEKARRKAEEKRQARIERELLEEEERKQREEVARLVEERRKLRDEIMGAEKDSCRSVSASKEKERKKEADRKRQERRKEKDIGSSKSNSDVEEMEKRAGKESDRKRDFDKKSESDRRENFRAGAETAKNHHIDIAHGHKNVGANNYSRGNAGSRYLDRMKGTLLSSSKALGGSSFFGRGSNTPAVSREKKPNASVDPFHHSANIKDFSTPVKSSMNGEDKAISRPAFTEPQLAIAPKKTWGQLFTRSPAAAPVPNPNVIGRPCVKSPVEVRSFPFMGHSPSGQVYDNPINFGLPSPFALPTFSYTPTSSCMVPPLTSEAVFPRIGEVQRDDYEIFEDPCYVPDPMSLLGPVSESLDDFQLDIGPGFATDIGLQRPGGLKRISTAEVNKPSPIESPMSRTRLLDEKHSHLNRPSNMLKAQDLHKVTTDNSYGENQNGTWQMWNTLPLGQDGLGLVGGGPASWMSPPGLKKDELPIAQKTAASLFSTDNQAFSLAHSHKVFSGGGHNVGNFATPVPGSTGDPWLPTTLFAQMPGTDGRFSSNPLEDSSQNEMMYGSPNSSATDHSFEFSHANGWAKNDRAGSAENTGSSSSTKPHIGGLYSTPDVQSLWSYES